VEAGERRLVLRVAPPRDSVFVFYERDMMRQEPPLHALLLENTTVPVAPVVAYDDSHAHVPRDFLLLERLPGMPLAEAPWADHETVMGQIGAQLAQVHGLTAETYGYIGAHRPMEAQTNWGDAWAIMWRKLVEDVTGVGYYDGGERDGLLRLAEQHHGLFDRGVPAHLLHMDVWAQNILVNEDCRVTALLDWDRALWGDREIEFAVLDYCGISTPAFWEGYGERRDDSREARVRNVFYVLYEMQKYIVIRAGRHEDHAGARGHKQRVMDVVYQAFGGLPGA
jgi:fructosamine-3-kinase